VASRELLIVTKLVRALHRSISMFDMPPSTRKCAMSGIIYRTLEELFADLPVIYLSGGPETDNAA
jgi:hypothetical protein